MFKRKWEDGFDSAFHDGRDFGDDSSAEGRKELYFLAKSGTYVGTTKESDGSDQAVRTHLEFENDSDCGKITGNGVDSEDGSYTVTGSRAGNRVKWVERYRNFSVTVRGRITSEGTIACRFQSSTGVDDRYELRRQQ